MTKSVTVRANGVFRQVHRSKKRYILMKGSAGSGKSTDTAQMYIVRLMCEVGRNLMCVRKTEESNRSSTFAELNAAIERMGVGQFWECGVSPLNMRCTLTGASVTFRGVQDAASREKLKSVTFAKGKLTDVWIEEATELEPNDFEMIDDRLRGKLPEGLFYQIKMTFNPVSASHWIKARFFDAPDDDTLLCSSTYKDNRFIDDAFSKRMERRRIYDPEGYRVYALGEWGVDGGQYFCEWRESIHVCEPFMLPKQWRRYITLDYGLDMLAAYFIAIDEQGHAYVYKEVYESGLIISDAAKAITRVISEDIYQVFAPPDLWNRRQDTGKSAADIFSENGLTLSRAENDRVLGWYDMREWLKVYTDEFGEERASLTIFRCCVNLIRTLPSLKHDARDHNDVAREPHELTHAPDAIRYFIAGRPAPCFTVRSDNGKLISKFKNQNAAKTKL